VIVATARTRTSAEPHRAHRTGAIQDVLHEIFVRVRAILRIMRWFRLNPVAIFCSSVALGSKSPASCSMVNRSNGKVPIERVDHPVAPSMHVPVGSRLN